MAKIVRVYYSTFVDVEMDENDFPNEEEMKDYVLGNMSDYISEQDLSDNLSEKPTDVEIINAEDLGYDF